MHFLPAVSFEKDLYSQYMLQHGVIPYPIGLTADAKIRPGC
jgi:hypothetical protein